MEKKTKKFSKLNIMLLVIPIIFSLIYAFSDYIVDFLWFRELGYISAFFKKLLTQLKIGVPVFIVVTLISYIYFKSLKKNYFEKIISESFENTKKINRISWGMGILLGLLASFIAAKDLWFSFLQFSNSTPFGYKDPIFNLDVSFYVFKLDFLKDLIYFLVVLLLGYLALTVLYYFILAAIRPPRIFKDTNQGFEEYDRFDNASGNEDKNTFGDILKSRFGNIKLNNKKVDNENIKNIFVMASKQLLIAGGLAFIFISVYFFLKQFDLLHSHRGAVYGAGYTDVKVTLWAYRICGFISLLGPIFLFLGIKKHKVRQIVLVPLAIMLVWVGSTGIGLVVQRFYVSPNEISLEKPYLERNIKFTQKAYGLNNIDVKDFPANNSLTAESIAKNDPTISNIRINDYKPAQKFYNQTQSIRQYYDFHDVDVDRYMVNGEYTQTFLAAREIDENNITQTWLNKHLKYTHGYGITLSRVDEVTASGQPSMLIKNIPPKSDVSEIDVTRPEIYFGEKAQDYSIVSTDEEEFDYPDGDKNKYARYEGTAGIKLNWFNRIIFGIHEKSFKLIVSSNINSDSKIIINRNIKDRVEKIMPYLDYDKEPYMVVDKGRLFWIIDAYTSTENFPYSEPHTIDDKRVNYVRNSVKVVIDAYNGNVDYYVVDEDDPIAVTFKKIYPKVFKDYSKMPEGIKKHIRYPNDLLKTQAKVYSRYHMEDASVFYQNEDIWDIAKEIYGTKEVEMSPSYYIMNLPGEAEAEFVNTLPFTPKDKKNMTGIILARNDGANYGKLVLFKLPKNKVVYGPRQIEAQIDQDPEISKEFSLWNSSGSEYFRGNMFVIPIEDSLLYVEPVYIEASESSIPEVKRVIVAYGDKIAYKNTLGEALNSLFGEGALGSDNKSSETDSQDDKKETKEDIIKKITDAYDNAVKYQRNGDWAKYGEYMKILEENLKKLK